MFTYIFVKLLHLTVSVVQRPTADASLHLNMIDLTQLTSLSPYSIFLRLGAFLFTLRFIRDLLSSVYHELYLLKPCWYCRPTQCLSFLKRHHTVVHFSMQLAISNVRCGLGLKVSQGWVICVKSKSLLNLLFIIAPSSWSFQLLLLTAVSCLRNLPWFILIFTTLSQVWLTFVPPLSLILLHFNLYIINLHYQYDYLIVYIQN